MDQTIQGSLAGLAATVPMTLLMEVLHRQLPQRERYALPPRKITMSMAKVVGLADKLDEQERQSATLASHFGYGAMAGAAYGAVGHKVLPGVTGGIIYGVGIWAISYLGWLPATGMYPSATKAPARRNALMIGAHVAWGMTLGMAAGKQSRS